MRTQSESESDTEESPLTSAGRTTESASAASASDGAKASPLPRSSTHGGGAADHIADFLALPSQVFIIFFLEFLNSYRNFGLRFVQYQYISNEFDMTDVETGSLLGVKSTMDIVFGIAGSLLTDAIGVRKTALMALSMATIGRLFFVLGRSSTALWITSLTFSPFGEAVLGTGIYTVALKKLTPPRLRPLAFAVQYASFNFSGALCDYAIDYLRMRDDVVLWGMRFSGLRVFIFTTWIAVVAALLVVVFLVHDYTVVDPSDPELVDEGGVQLPELDINGVRLDFAMGTDGKETSRTPAGSLPDGSTRLRCWGELMQKRKHATARYRIVHTPLRSEDTGAKLAAVYRDQGAVAAVQKVSTWFADNLVEILRLRQLWRVMCFSLSVFFVSKQWGDMDTMLIPFLERYYGEDTPAYTIHSLNLWGCLLLPPIVGALTGKYETFAVILPGMWVMAFSPMFLAVSPTVLGALLWLAVMTIGEVAWSPRQSAWAASVAPIGREGVFVAVGSLKSLLIAWPSQVFNGYMNQQFVPNCKSCRDEIGHFCDQVQKNMSHSVPVFGCASESGELCAQPDGGWASARMGDQEPGQIGTLRCPETCLECPGWVGDARTMWGIVWLTSLSSPLLVWAFLPYLRGRRDALCKCSAQRLAGICGGGSDSEEEAAEGVARALFALQPTSSSSTSATETAPAQPGSTRRSENAPTL